MPGPSKQFAAQQQAALDRLRSHIPEGCPLTVERVDPETAWRTRVGFRVVGPGCEMTGRMQVALAFIDGYVAAWEATRELGHSFGQAHEAAMALLPELEAGVQAFHALTEGEAVKRLEAAVSDRDQTILNQVRILGDQRRELDALKAELTATTQQLEAAELDAERERVARRVVDEALQQAFRALGEALADAGRDKASPA